MGRTVHHLPVEKGYFELQPRNVLETLHGEVVEVGVGLIPLKGFDKKGRFEERCRDFGHLVAILGFADVEDLLVGVEVVSIPLDYPPVSKMNDDLILYLDHDKLPSRLCINTQRTDE